MKKLNLILISILFLFSCNNDQKSEDVPKVEKDLHDFSYKLSLEKSFLKKELLLRSALYDKRIMSASDSYKFTLALAGLFLSDSSVLKGVEGLQLSTSNANKRYFTDNLLKRVSLLSYFRKTLATKNRVLPNFFKGIENYLDGHYLAGDGQQKFLRFSDLSEYMMKTSYKDLERSLEILRSIKAREFHIDQEIFSVNRNGKSFSLRKVDSVDVSRAISSINIVAHNMILKSYYSHEDFLGFKIDYERSVGGLPEELKFTKVSEILSNYEGLFSIRGIPVDTKKDEKSWIVLARLHALEAVEHLKNIHQSNSKLKIYGEMLASKNYEYIDGDSGLKIWTNFVRLYQYPPSNLRNFLPSKFDLKVKSGDGDRVRYNSSLGQPLAWDRSKYNGYIISNKTDKSLLLSIHFMKDFRDFGFLTFFDYIQQSVE